jgi:hypothetical protein
VPLEVRRSDWRRSRNPPSLQVQRRIKLRSNPPYALLRADVARRTVRAWKPCANCPSCQHVAGISACAVGQITTILSRIPPRCRGALRPIVTKREAGCGGRGSVGRDRVAGRTNLVSGIEARKTNGAEAYGKSVWSWHPLLVSSRRRPVDPTGRGHVVNSPATVARRIRRRGEYAIRRKTIAWGMPDGSGASAVNTRAHTHYPQRARGCGCIGHPAFPAPFVCIRAKDFGKISGV